MFAVFQTLFCGGNLVGLVVDCAGILVEVLFAKLDFEGLELYLFRKEVKLAVISYVVELFLVARDF